MGRTHNWRDPGSIQVGHIEFRFNNSQAGHTVKDFMWWWSASHTDGTILRSLVIAIFHQMIILGMSTQRVMMMI